ncbi:MULTISPECIES: hypothetical protein [Vibrio]|jgi:hypothetical protein|uniref:hypothetical protein n=1 Tax=Vibrio TaxID=662 RepID=UPI001EDFA6BD|nr:hypothetical protein [Vibrio cincinnatiensis]MCG3727795.1 hypothetical protein [Vibrio cincinnatiensis]
MDKVKIKAIWSEETDPNEVGVYLVALRHVSGFGSYDYLYWDGKCWLNKTTSDIVGWSPVASMLTQIDAGWPENDLETDVEFEKYRKQHGGKFSEDDFVEVE